MGIGFEVLISDCLNSGGLITGGYLNSTGANSTGLNKGISTGSSSNKLEAFF